MSQAVPDRSKQFSTSLPNELRRAASETKDPALRRSLLQQAEKMELAEVRLNSVASSGQEALDSFRADVRTRRRSRELPRWVVAVTLLAFAIFLVLVALKHYV